MFFRIETWAIHSLDPRWLRFFRCTSYRMPIQPTPHFQKLQDGWSADKHSVRDSCRSGSMGYSQPYNHLTGGWTYLSLCLPSYPWRCFGMYSSSSNTPSPSTLGLVSPNRPLYHSSKAISKSQDLFRTYSSVRNLLSRSEYSSCCWTTSQPFLLKDQHEWLWSRWSTWRYGSSRGYSSL